MSGNREEKKLVYLSKSLVDELVKMARKHGTSIGKLVEDSVSHLLSLDELGLNLREALEILKTFKLLKALGGVFIPQYVLECFKEHSCASREDKLKKWYEAGRMYGVYLREKSENNIMQIIKQLRVFLNLSRWDLSDVSIIGNENSYKLCCTSIVLDEEDTAYLAEFIKGILEGLGAEISSLEYARGLIVVKFKATKT